MPTPPVKFPKPRRSSGKPPVRKGEGNGGGAPTPPADQNWRGMLLLFFIILAVILLYYAMIHPAMVQDDIKQSDLFNMIRAGQVDSIVNQVDPSTGVRSLTGTYPQAGRKDRRRI